MGYNNKLKLEINADPSFLVHSWDGFLGTFLVHVVVHSSDGLWISGQSGHDSYFYFGKSSKEQDPVNQIHSSAFLT